MTANAPRTGGTTVTLVGSNFGLAEQPLLYDRERCACATWASDTAVACEMRRGADIGAAAITVEALVGTVDALLFTFDAPVTTQIRYGP